MTAVKKVWDGVGGKKTWDTLRGKDAERAAKQASKAQIDAQREALDYLKESEAAPRYYADAARSIIGGELGITPYQDEGMGGENIAAAPSLVDRAKSSPLYSAIMGGRKAGEQAISRSALATGGLRGGATIGNLAGFGRDLQNQALLQSYNQQLGLAQNLMGAPTLAPQIAQQTSNIGKTQALGITGAAQAKQQGLQNLIDLGTKAASAYTSGGLI